MELSNMKICAAIPTSRTVPEVVPRMPKKKTCGLGELLPQHRGVSLVNTMKIDGVIVQLASKDNYSLACCYQAEISKYEFSN
ncbi:uncharacterized protein encoded by LINC01551-like [Pteronotus mesoamericanus]|uniref:uncharacterized protein encoded by LINC01551-like n=1 Tax=Pteronotus mesoamericanus TaxID=1884717 RepID=UPI0023EB7E74|nr:uncharacterized protein encoded by LINC01551-like [Pteronotus parnellii mesoamericanus]